MTTSQILLMISPSLDADSKPAYSNTKGPLFDGKIGDRIIVKRSAAPFCSAARVLLDEGAAPETPLVMRRAGDGHDALRSTVGRAAGPMVTEGRAKPRFVDWTPYDGPLARSDDEAVSGKGRRRTHQWPPPRHSEGFGSGSG